MRALPAAIGLGIGFLLGWLVFGTGAEPRETPPDAPPSTRRAAERHRTPAIASEEGPARIDVAETLRRGPLERLWPLVNDRERTWTSAEVRALIERVDRARAEGTANEFMAALRGLGMAGTEAAQKKLLEILVDETLIPPSRMGHDMLTGLGDSDLPGIAAGVRKRIDMNVASGKASWTWGYFGLLVRRGAAEDIAWLAERAASGHGRHDAREALAKSSNPLAVQSVVRLIEEGKGDQDLLRHFARPDNAAAAPLIRRVLQGELKAAYRELSAVFRAYGNAVPEDGLDAALEYLLSLREPLQRVSAVYAVESMRRRGLEVVGFERVIGAPIEFLEAATAESDRSVASKARYAIEYNRVTWSERAALALERAAGVYPASSMTRGMVVIAKEIRAGLASPWR